MHYTDEIIDPVAIDSITSVGLVSRKGSHSLRCVPGRSYVDINMISRLEDAA